LVRCLAVAHQWVVFSVHTPAQHAIASALHVARHPYEGKDSYYAWLKDEYLRKKQLLETGLRAAGLPPISPEGGFFVMARTESVLPLLPKRFLDEGEGRAELRKAVCVCVCVTCFPLSPSS